MSDMAPTHDSNSIGIAGTLGYLAPEYATNNFISSQGDMYSYGILLLEMFTNKRPTEEEFYDHINLHSFVSNAFPNHILKIVDQDILRGLHMNPKIKDCLEGTLRIGIACSRTVPRDRMSITDVVKDLRKIRVYYLS
ncbi:hypothetical protein C2S53_018156 [Perilla frutescens var. hirtella]|uniref:Protein kinase domain-containing protein n=1 Tax=Perilla frutescens var. hirtella TaxID=608512 RepID=A0AAD4P012_PERFH|nr:hypothetical protein C2S53_018156 [Perilla frutescens var. hirtella]